MSGAATPGPKDSNGDTNNTGRNSDRNESLANVVVPNIPQIPYARDDNTSGRLNVVTKKRMAEEEEESDKRQRFSTTFDPRRLPGNTTISEAPSGADFSNTYRTTNTSTGLPLGDGFAQSPGPFFFSMNDQSFRQPSLSARLLREEYARNQVAATRAMLLSQLTRGDINGQYGRSQSHQGPNSLTYPATNPHFSVNSASVRGLNFNMIGGAQRLQQTIPWVNQFQNDGMPRQLPIQLSQLASLQSFDHLGQVHQGSQGGSQRSNDFVALSGVQDNLQGSRSQDLASMLRNLITRNGMLQTTAGERNDSGQPLNPNVASLTNVEPMQASLPQQGALVQQHFRLPQQGLLELPRCEEGQIDSHYCRPFFPLGIEEDPNWLSEFHCYVRSDIIEVFRASRDDVMARNTSIAYQQIGLRCRFCAHITPSARAGRSSAFPSSSRQIYQSFTMMLRDHFANCDAMPVETLEKFTQLKDKPAQGATDSKRYWIYAATKIGMRDTSDGLMVTDQSRVEGMQLSPFGTMPNQKWEDDAFKNVPLVLPFDRTLTAEFLFVLMSQVQPIRLTEAECIGNRRSLRVGLPGFGCKYCCDEKRLGHCRMFPARRRTLPSKMNDMYDHLRRCTLCPIGVKELLESTKRLMKNGFLSDQGGDREFFDRVWTRLGHTE